MDIMDISEINEMFGGLNSDFFDLLYNSFAEATEGARFYLVTLVDFIESEEQKGLKRLEEIEKTIPDSRRDDFWEYNYPFWWKDIFEKNLKESFIVSLFSILEVYLKRTCDHLHMNDSKSKTAEKCKGDSKFHQFHKCLKQYAPAVSNLDWDQIYKLWRIRNAITHNDGVCREKDKKLLGQLVDNNGYIQIDIAFCKESLLTIRNFGLDLHPIIMDYINGLKKTRARNK